MKTYSDAYLNHYADRYVRLELKRHGIGLLQYLADPVPFEAVAELAVKLEQIPEPLITPQRVSEMQARRTAAAKARAAGAGIAEIEALESRAEPGLEACPRRGGAIVEPLHHHRMPSGRQSQFHGADSHGHRARRTTP